MSEPQPTFEEQLAYYRAQFDALVANGTNPQRAEGTVAQQVHTDFGNKNPERMKALIAAVQKFA